jgi:hypothetical protein
MFRIARIASRRVGACRTLPINASSRSSTTNLRNKAICVSAAQASRRAAPAPVQQWRASRARGERCNPQNPSPCLESSAMLSCSHCSQPLPQHPTFSRRPVPPRHRRRIPPHPPFRPPCGESRDCALGGVPALSCAPAASTPTVLRQTAGRLDDQAAPRPAGGSARDRSSRRRRCGCSVRNGR